MVALLFLVAMVNNLDRQALSVLAPSLRERLGFGPIEYSYVVTAFLAAYTLGYAFCGPVLDRVGVKVGLAVALAFWSLSGMLHAAATGWVSLAIFRFMLGLGESFNSPAGVKAIADWIPPRERGLSMAVFSNGNIFGAILAPPLVSFLAIHFGWRWGFIVTGAMGLALLVMWWRHYRSPDQDSQLTPVERDYLAQHRDVAASAAKSVSMWALLAQPICVGFFVARFVTDPIVYFFSFWLPDYLTHARGFTLAMIGLVGWLPFLASDVGGPGGGALSDWLVRRGWASRQARQTLMLVAACLMPLANVAVRTESAWLAVGLIAMLLAAQSCWMANQLALISESVPRESVASLLALSALGGSLGGMLSTLGTGRVIAAYGYVPVFTVLSSLHPIAYGVLFLTLQAQNRRQLGGP
jgi:ACS family hexuronate transporter-like MFS transporter